MRDWLRALHDELREHGAPVVRIVVATVRGSAPREPGASMLVTPDGERGTIGGGHLEFVATAIARDLLAASAPASRVDRFSLGASLGQCCGGIVELWFQRYDAADLPLLARALAARARGESQVIEGQRLLAHDEAMAEGAKGLATLAAVLLPGASGARLYESIRCGDTPLWLFGAGHVAQALVHVLAPLPFALTWLDSRENWCRRRFTENSSPTPIIFAPQPADEVHEMPAGAWALVMTHSHDEDFAISEALLRDGRFGWAGVIGSAPKAKRFRQRLQQRGFSADAIARLAMPIGIDGIRSKEPAAIAVAVAAQLLQLRDACGTRVAGSGEASSISSAAMRYSITQ